MSESNEGGKRQVDREFDTSPDRFLSNHPEDTFSGASGVLFEQAMAQTRMAICLCDPRQPDIPIVFANRAFRELTGYDEEEILGRNCRFLQGPGTASEPVQVLRDAIKSEEVVVVELLNYRKDGTPFWNALHLGPIYDDQGDLLYFFGSQWDVSDVRAARADEQHARLMARELSHRMKNMFSVISGIVNVTGRVRNIPEAAAEINGRIQALGRAYETTLDEASTGSIEVSQAIRAMMQPYVMSPERFELRGDAIRVPFPVVSVIGVTLHELAANAANYGAWSVEDGKVELDWELTSGESELCLHWKEVGGPKVSPPPEEGGTGRQVVDRMLNAARGRIERDWKTSGLEAVIYLPVTG